MWRRRWLIEAERRWRGWTYGRRRHVGYSTLLLLIFFEESLGVMLETAMWAFKVVYGLRTAWCGRPTVAGVPWANYDVESLRSKTMRMTGRPVRGDGNLVKKYASSTFFVKGGASTVSSNRVSSAPAYFRHVHPHTQSRIPLPRATTPAHRHNFYPALAARPVERGRHCRSM